VKASMLTNAAAANQTSEPSTKLRIASKLWAVAPKELQKGEDTVASINRTLK
jgi:alpha-D-ribose 1-methylphosphonate 5-triphosphate synthase subunit PhnL